MDISSLEDIAARIKDHEQHNTLVPVCIDCETPLHTVDLAPLSVDPVKSYYCPNEKCRTYALAALKYKTKYTKEITDGK